MADSIRKHEDKTMIQRGLNIKEASKYIGVSVSTFRRMIVEGKIKKGLPITRGRVVWDVRELDSLLDNLKLES
ncbi:helix-turn-helix domain-containing protein [Marinobacter sp.]|uniref:helix-turn-helix transcriptional regulator n=2 Tax=Marinobacter sp. TaxID=50741 RepID=UPI0023571B32